MTMDHGSPMNGCRNPWTTPQGGWLGFDLAVGDVSKIVGFAVMLCGENRIDTRRIGYSGGGIGSLDWLGQSAAWLVYTSNAEIDGATTLSWWRCSW